MERRFLPLSPSGPFYLQPLSEHVVVSQLWQPGTAATVLRPRSFQGPASPCARVLSDAGFWVLKAD